MKTKCFSGVKLWAGVLVGLTAAGIPRISAQSDTLLPSTIVRMKGHARCSTDSGKTWRMVKVGDTVDSGSMIQTAFKSDLDLVLGERATPPADGAFFDPGTHAAHVVSFSEDTLLRIDKLARKPAAASQPPAEEILLDLRKGMITGNVRKLAGGSRYEIAFINGVAGAREGVYKLRANGELSVLKGKAFVALGDGKAAREIAAGTQFNPATGGVASLPPQAAQSAGEPQTPAPRAEASPESAPPARALAPPTRRAQPPTTGLRRAGP